MIWRALGVLIDKKKRRKFPDWNDMISWQFRSDEHNWRNGNTYKNNNDIKFFYNDEHNEKFTYI